MPPPLETTKRKEALTFLTKGLITAEAMCYFRRVGGPGTFGTPACVAGSLCLNREQHGNRLRRIANFKRLGHRGSHVLELLRRCLGRPHHPQIVTQRVDGAVLILGRGDLLDDSSVLP